MYTLLNGLYKYITQKEEYFIIILGLDNAGKTTLLERIKSIFLGVPGLPPDKIAPTIGLNIGKIDMNNSKVNFWDLGGQRDLRTIWDKYYTECHAIVFVVDATDQSRIEECKGVFERLVTNDEIEGVPILMLANKQDQPNAMKVEDIKEIFNQIASRLGARDSKVLPCSALSGWVWHILLRMLYNTKCRSSFIIFYPFALSCFEHISDGVKDAVDWLFLRIQRNRQNRPPVFRQ